MIRTRLRSRMDISKLLIGEYYCGRSRRYTRVLTSHANGDLPKNLRKGLGNSPFKSTLHRTVKADETQHNPDLVIARVTPNLIKLLLTSNLLTHDEVDLHGKVDVEHVSEVLFDRYIQREQNTIIVPVSLFIQYINGSTSEGALI